MTTRLEDGTVVDQKTNFKCILGHLEVVQGSSILVNELYFFLKLILPRKYTKNTTWVPIDRECTLGSAYNKFGYNIGLQRVAFFASRSLTAMLQNWL